MYIRTLLLLHIDYVVIIMFECEIRKMESSLGDAYMTEIFLRNGFVMKEYGAC